MCHTSDMHHAFCWSDHHHTHPCTHRTGVESYSSQPECVQEAAEEYHDNDNDDDDDDYDEDDDDYDDDGSSNSDTEDDDERGAEEYHDESMQGAQTCGAVGTTDTAVHSPKQKELGVVGTSARLLI
jgi:midasin (ATPase involved in ribosome maturation)